MAEIDSSDSWTLFGLIVAFIDLAFAYFLLCLSTFAFFFSKFCNFFGLYLPCPCTGFFGYHNTSICLHKFLIEYPMKTISAVQMSVTTKSPFNLISLKRHQPGCYDTMSCRILEYDNEAGSGSLTIQKLQNSVDRERKYDVKGKKVVNQKQKSGTRRLRRSAIPNGKSNKRLVAAEASSSQFSGPVDPGSSIEAGFQDDVIAALNALDPNERAWCSFEQIKPFGRNVLKEIDSPSVGKISYNIENEFKNGGNEENEIRLLKEALEEERAACMALYVELEKERAAAATAADEAMAMILRLQEDKASVQMEARQYHRMIEEKFTYDEEEMKILKEILVKKEQEIHFLEKELEEYKQMRSLGNDQLGEDFAQKPLHSRGWYEDPSPMPQEIEKRDSIDKCETDRENLLEVVGDQQEQKHDIEPMIYDVHVIDDKTGHQKVGSWEESDPSKFTATGFGVGIDGDLNSGSSSEAKSTVPVTDKSQSKTLFFDSANNTPIPTNNERLKIDTEVELLRERLRAVQEGKEKLIFSADLRESINAQLKLVEEIVNQLQEIQQLKEPIRNSSLPPSSSKASLKKRRCRSASLEANESS